MQACFKWVGWYEVKQKYQHQVPKYLLVYATRSDHGIELMNDAMCKARREFVKDQFPNAGFLFEQTPAQEDVDHAKIASQLLKAIPHNGSFTRRSLRLQ